jgi:hypothetical protein
MKATKIHDITLDTDETIMTATLSKSDEVVMLMSSGSVIRFNLDDQKGKHLFSVKSDIGYSDGGFDITAKTSIYTMDEIVVVVNDFKRHGFVHYPDKYYALHLWREDYHADISTYPIVFYKSEDSVPHLIFGEAWNHIQIMNLDTRQILTASKSLIEENAEERHIEFYKKHNDVNKLAWPRPYDYFFGKLFLSPNQKKFLSAGWAWGSCDSYNVYNIEHFISSNRISDLRIGAWEHENRATCWVDNETIAVAYNPFTEGDDNSTADSPCEIHFHKIREDNVEIDKKIQIADKNILSSKMYFNGALDSLIIVSDKGGLSVISLDGQVVFKDENLKTNEYSIDTGCFLVADNKTISIYEITE